jgi:hypothetical protein
MIYFASGGKNLFLIKFKLSLTDNVKYFIKVTQLGITFMFQELKFFLRKAFIPWGQSLNYNALIVLAGIGVWGICGLGEAFGYAHTPSYVVDIGQMLFSFGIGRASVSENKQK